MKVRKLAVALALAGGLGSGVAQALGLGEIELQSYLNEPMDAEITLPQSRGVDPGDVFVNVAPERAYQRLGLERSQFVGKLRFNVATTPDGNLVVNVSSREPLREPYLNFLLELTWPNGRLMREYAVLVDPPVFAEDSGIKEQISAPVAQSRPATSARSPESVRRQARVEQSRAGGYGSDTFGPTGAADTLWTIAAAVRPDNSLSMQQVMLALQDLNPDAFIGNNINRLKRGQVLRVPSAEQIRSRSRAEATRMVAQQNQEFQQPKRAVDATPDPQLVAAATGEAPAGGDELKLLVADDVGGRTEVEGGSAGGDGQLAGGVDAGSAIVMEELESARRENDELNSRVDDLQDQVQTLQRLLELKNSQLAELQQATAAGEAQAETAPVAPVTDEEAVAESGTVATDQADTSADVSGADEVAQEGVAEAGDLAEAGEAGTESAETAMSEMETEAGVVDAASESQPEEEVAEAGQAGPAAAGEAPQVAPAQVEQVAQADTAEPKVQPKPEPVVEKGFPGNLIDAITGNTLYQIALGGGLIILLLILLLLARRSANREKAFYEEFNSEPEAPDDTFDLTLDDEEAGQPEVDSNALEEVDTYLAYGRYDQAAQVLETAISREPSRTDLRLKLLGVYADNRDRESFEKQYGEIETLGDDEALAQAKELSSRLEEAESTPSIDDLESQLRSETFGEDSDVMAGFVPEDSEVEEATETSLTDELLADQYDASREETVENEFGDFDSEFGDFDLDALEEAESAAEEKADETEDAEGEAKKDSADDLIEYDLSGLELPGKDSEDISETADQAEELAGLEDDLSSLEIDLEDDSHDEALDSLLEESGELGQFDDLGVTDELDEASGSEPELEPEAVVGEPLDSDAADLDSLDESFLDELDAELDKVAGEEDELEDIDLEESTLSDLELDISDEDLALIEEISESPELAEVDLESEEASLEDELSLDEELGLDDTLEPESEGSDEDEELPVASEKVVDETVSSPIAEIEEDDLGDDDDFDFLAGTDEAATKLDLARAYIEMGDTDGARDILEEVALEGDEEQKAEAQELLKNLS